MSVDISSDYLSTQEKATALSRSFPPLHQTAEILYPGSVECDVDHIR